MGKIFQLPLSLGDIIAFFALIAAVWIGVVQNKINRRLLQMQDLIDIYLNICIDESEGKTPRAQVQIRNISTIPVSLIHYRFNGVERSIAPYRLPPASQYSEAYYYIWLPENGIADYVSFSLYFMDSMKRVWRMDGFAEIKNGRWEVSSQQPVMQNRE